VLQINALTARYVTLRRNKREAGVKKFCWPFAGYVCSVAASFFS